MNVCVCRCLCVQFLADRNRQIERTCAQAANGMFARNGRGGGGFGCVTFGTSIWDESLFKAWSQIVQMLLPNANHVGLALSRLAEALDADELILFEKSTFLVRSRILYSTSTLLYTASSVVTITPLQYSTEQYNAVLYSSVINQCACCCCCAANQYIQY